MINVDDRLFAKVDSSEMWLLLHITKRLGKKMYCWPSNNTLMKDTGWKIDKLRDVKKSLIEKGLISVEIKEGTSNIYRVETSYLGVYIGADQLSDTPPEKPTTPTRKNQPPSPSEKPTDKYYQVEVLTSNSIGASATDIILEKKKAFQETIRPHIPEFGKDMCNSFYTYWSEAAKNGKKLKWELEETWEIKLRLVRWKKNDDERKATKKGFGPVAAEPVFKQAGTNNQHILDDLYKNQPNQ